MQKILRVYIELVTTVQGRSGKSCAKFQLLELASKPITAPTKKML